MEPSERRSSGRKKSSGGFDTMENSLMVGSLAVILALAVVIVAVWASYSSTQRAYKNLEKTGERLASVQSVGKNGIEALSDYLLAQSSPSPTIIPVIEEPSEEPSAEPTVKPTMAPTPSKEPEEIKPENINVSVSCVSVDKDLKIKFVDVDREKDIAGYAFEVVLKDKSGKETTYVDNDKDGVIYITGLKGGDYALTIKSLFGFTFPEAAQTVAVKEHIDYVVINVIDEVKNVAQVDVKQEDAQATNSQEVIEVESELKDTVSYVSSTKTEVFKEVEYSTIAKPVKRSTPGNTEDEPAGPQEPDPNPPATEPATDPTTPATDPTTPATDPTTPATDPTTPGTDPTTPATDPTTPGTDPTEPETPVTPPEVTRETLPTAIPASSLTFDKENLNIQPSGSNDNQKKGSVTVSLADFLSADLKEIVTVGTPTYAWTIAENSYLSIDGDAGKATVTVTGNQTPEAKTNVTLTVTVSAVLTQNNLPEGAEPNTCTATGTKTFTVTVSPKEITAIKVQTTTTNPETFAELKQSKTAGTLTPVVIATYSDGTTATLQNSDVTWSVDKTEIASVSGAGVITAVSDGEAIVTASYKAAGAETAITATYKVTVPYDAAFDTVSPLVDEKDRQIYVLDTESGKKDTYRKAVYADYYTPGIKFYLKTNHYTGWQTLEDNHTYYFDKDGEAVTGAQVIQGVQYNFTKDGYLQMSSTQVGIDVSSWQGEINWAQVKASGVTYAIVRVGYRGYGEAGTLVEDPYFAKNVIGAYENGIKVGLYFFSQAITEAEAVEEASTVINLLTKYGLNKYVSYPIFFDSEYGNNKHTGRADSIDAVQRTACAKAFCETVKNAGYKPGIYASKSWFMTKLDMSTLNSYTVWLAQYATAADYSGRYDMWQYSSKGTVGGINGNVDMNYSYLSY